MDAGLAAVLGALAGSVATIGAALAAGWAQREGARITARSEHRRQRREPRQAVYTELIAVASELQAMTGQYAYDIEILEDMQLSALDVPRLMQRQTAVEKKAIEAALAGPKSVSELALKISKMSHDVMLYTIAVNGFTANPGAVSERAFIRARERLKSASKSYGSALEGLVNRAQAALDDDGSRRFRG